MLCRSEHEIIFSFLLIFGVSTCGFSSMILAADENNATVVANPFSTLKAEKLNVRKEVVLNRRRRLTKTPSPFKWRKNTLKYHVKNSAKGLSLADVRDAIAEAFSKWSAVIPIDFIEVGNDNEAELNISFASGSHNCYWPFDGKGGVRGHATAPTSVFTHYIHFDDDETWVIKDADALRNNETVDLVYMALHEIGHTLGLNHLDHLNAVMAPFMIPTLDDKGRYALELTAYDIAEAQKLYGVRETKGTSGVVKRINKVDESRDSNGTQDGMTSLEWKIILAVFAILIIVTLCLLAVFASLSRAKTVVGEDLQLVRLNESESISQENCPTDVDVDVLYSYIKALHITKFDSRFLIPISKIGKSKHILGTGNFGLVYCSTYQKSRMKKECIDVACKQLHGLNDEEKQAEFLMEATIMMSLRHTHAVGIHGVAFNEAKIPILVMELLSGGSLYNYLRTNQTIESEGLRFGKEIASGMFYLHSCKLIHRDLAARNCLLSSNLLLKITDFGLARELEDEYIFQHTRPLPWRWTAPEAHFQQIVCEFEPANPFQATTKSDVWAYGVTLWEIYSGAELPYREEDSPQRHFESIKHGLRLRRPTDCSQKLYVSVLRQCWSIEPKNRPNFSDIFVEMLKRHESSLEQGQEVAPSDPSAAVDDRRMRAQRSNGKADAELRTSETSSVGYEVVASHIRD